jgi:hypothetical protein
MGEQQVYALAGAAVGELWLIRADGLPGIDGLAEDRVDRLGEGGAGFVGRDVEETHSVAGQDLLGVTGDRGAVVLPTDAAHPQSGDPVAALSGELSGQCDRADQLEGVELPDLGLWEIRSFQVQTRPQKLRPDLIGNHPRVGAEEAVMLRGIASARNGSELRGSHSHSWQSLKNVSSAVICPALVAASSGLPRRSPRPAVRCT